MVDRLNRENSRFSVGRRAQRVEYQGISIMQIIASIFKNPLTKKVRDDNRTMFCGLSLRMEWGEIEVVKR